MGQSGPEAPVQTLNKRYGRPGWYYWLEEWGISFATKIPLEGDYDMISLYFEDISDVKVVPPSWHQSKLFSVVFSLVVEGQPLTSTLTINRCEEGQARFLLAKIKPHLKPHL